MKDRVPRYPGRVQLTPVPGQANTYDLVRADDPAEPGTPLNKASLLQDNTATALGLSGDPTVNDALANVAPRIKALEDSLKFVKLADVTISASAQQVDIVLPKPIDNYSSIQIYLSNMLSGSSFPDTYVRLQGQATNVYRKRSSSGYVTASELTVVDGATGSSYGNNAEIRIAVNTKSTNGRADTLVAEKTVMTNTPTNVGDLSRVTGYTTTDGGLPLNQINTINIVARTGPFMNGRIVIYGVLV